MHTKAWTWVIHDYSMASLVGKDSELDVVLSVAPCDSCADEENKEWHWDKCNVPSEANARLIAAAPELLEALKSAVSEDTLASFLIGYEKPLWLDTATEAIRKAKGE